jgi:hypothetical protein
VRPRKVFTQDDPFCVSSEIVRAHGQHFCMHPFELCVHRYEVFFIRLEIVRVQRRTNLRADLVIVLPQGHTI